MYSSIKIFNPERIELITTRLPYRIEYNIRVIVDKNLAETQALIHLILTYLNKRCWHRGKERAGHTR